ncbi:MAG: hypothetical protein FWH06_03735 [Oscillospiraceae bacterium]|nr:hypothetical protein [Oscillospiraceae bacterium]
MKSGDALFPNVFRAGADDSHIVIEFGQAATGSDKPSDDDVKILSRIVLAPEQVLPLTLCLVTEGARYNEE